MSTVQRDLGGSVASMMQKATNDSSKIQAIPRIGQQKQSFAEKTKGSVFGAAAGNFGSLAIANRMQGSPSDNTRVANAGQRQGNPIGQQRRGNSPQIGNLLAGNFGSLTNKADRSGMVHFQQGQNKMDTDQLSQKSGDQLEKEALALEFMKPGGDAFVA